MAEIPISEIMDAYSQDAVDFARERFKINLDFSENSLEQVESMLSDMHTALPRGLFAKLRNRPSDNQIWDMAKMWGGYIGEVIRRCWGGEWRTSTPIDPGIVITLHVLGHDIYPPAKAHKRMINGPEDNIWHYYMVLRQDFEQRSASDAVRP